MTDLAAFLLARIAEDEAVAAEAGGDTWEVADERKVRWVRNGGNAHGWVAIADLSTATEHIANWDPARVLAECDAKRRIVEQLWLYVARPDPTSLDPSGTEALWMIKTLALPYADHPDFREEWRP